MTLPRTPTERTCGILDFWTVQTMIRSGATYHDIAAVAHVSHSAVCGYVRLTGLAVGKHLRGRRSRVSRAMKVKV